MLAQEDWHEGVIGIVASRLVERFHRPVVLIAGSQDGWKGSGRSIPRFDLHGALAACSEHLERFGGHRAAAGLSIDPYRIDAFAEAFAAHADAVLTDGDLQPVTVVEGIVSAEDLTLPLAQELDRLAPFGLGNPDVTLLVPGAQPVVAGDRRRGQAPPLPRAPERPRRRDRDRVRPGRAARPAARRRPLRRRLPAQGEPLERHRRAAARRPPHLRHARRYEELRDWMAELWRAGEGAWTPEARRIFAELGLDATNGRRRQLLESETFRDLLEREALPRAA